MTRSLGKVSDKPYLRGRLIDEFNKFTAAIFGNTPFFTRNRDTRFETGLAEAIVDYNELRIDPLEAKDDEHDRRLDDHERRIRQLEQIVRNSQFRR
jgi:hypothetical protein